MPTPVEAVHLLALMTRARQASHDLTGKPAQKFVYHVHAFKTALAELGYYRILAQAGDHGGSIATSMPQLVTGLAPLHPRWDMSGGWFGARDRHQRAVRKRLEDLASLGVLSWRAGTDDDGEERRTEIYLLPAPAVSDSELQAAGEKLAVWEARYGPALNTGSSTEVRDALRHGQPLSASERQRRGVEHAKRGGSARRLRDQRFSPSSSKTAPPSGALRNRSEYRKRSHTRSVSDPNARDASASNRESIPTDAIDNAPRHTTAAFESEGGGTSSPSRAQKAPEAPSRPVWGSEEWERDLVTRIQGRLTERASLVGLLANQALVRTAELAGWGLERDWPRRRLAEAWVVAHHGATAAAEGGTNSAGPLSLDAYAKLRRTVARYERNADARPKGWPAGGLQALLHLGALAATGQLHAPPRTIEFAIDRLAMTARRMRARASAVDPRHGELAARRSSRRREPVELPENPTPAQRFQREFRGDGTRWPRWILLPGAQEPTFDAAGSLMLDEETIARYGPSPSSEHYRLWMRDAYHLAGRSLPPELDGRRTMAARADGHLPAGRRPEGHSIARLELAELARHTGQPVADLQRLSPLIRTELLEHARRAAAAQASVDAAQLRSLLASLSWDRR